MTEKADDGRVQVLIVDDDNLARTLVVEVTENMGLSCAQAGSGEEAIRWFAEKRADLVLLDIVMPGMDGLETLRVLKEMDPQVMVIMTTGQREFNSVVEAMRLGAFDYVSKPFQIAILENSIRRALDRHEMIMERDRLFEELQAAKGLLQGEVVRRSGMAAVGTLAAGVAHEFNNLIGAMLGYAELAVRSGESRLQEQAIQVVLKSCARAKHIIGNLLVYARRQQAEPQTCRLSELMENTLALLERDFHKKEIEICREYFGDDSAFCDPGQIAQVLFTVIDNAREAMYSGGKLIVTIDSTGPDHRIVIADQGIGIPPEFLARIFEPFAYRDTLIAGHRIGLGLCVASMILQEHKGHIEIESRLNQGTTVRISLPKKTPSQVLFKKTAG